MIIFKEEQNLEENINKYKKITLTTSIIRIIIAITVVVFVIMLFSLQEFLLYGILSGISFLVFIIVLLFTNRYYNHLLFLNIKKEVYNKHKKRREHDLNTFFDTGIDFIDKDDYKESDLDLFGKNSLYQYLNVSKTKRGRIKLANILKNGQDKNQEYTKALKELAENEKSLDIEAKINKISNQSSKIDTEEILSALSNKIKFNFFFIIPLLSFIGTIIYLVLIFTLKLNPLFIIVFLLLNFIFSKLFLRCEQFNIKATLYENLFDSFIDISNTYINNEYNSEYLNDYKKRIIELLPKLKSAKNLVDILSFRYNFLFQAIGNSLFIIDFYIILLFNKKVKNNYELKELFEIISDIEVMLSLSIIGIDNEIYCIPSDSNEIEFNDLYHPLIKNPVSNSLLFNKGIILTGSNMSGKTTFLRTIGIAQILYNANGLIPAKSFSTNHLDIYTSLRANDMLEEGISTFYAEILRMKKINEAIKKGPCLVLIDEIFKGTNLNERLEASFKIIEKLNNNSILFIISTHDLEITEAKGIINYHFNEYYKDDKIYFDYIIKEGKSNTSNALYLLKMADII
ncbi:MAG: hypothetical protein IJM36_03315 [Acholeplasmatales bacterium]|nr:hypothetical protein [Acholeplasmatales bacterium]